MKDINEFIGKIINGDCLEVLKTMPDNSINCCITSPPYWALRNYNIDGQLGLEKTFVEYIDKLCNIFDEIKRILKDDGTCFVNIGDTYSGSGNGSWNAPIEIRGKQYRKTCNIDQEYLAPPIRNNMLPDKCLCMIPFRFAIEMVNRGWILRNTIIWHKPNCMPSSVIDRFTVDFEYVFFFVKSKKYWFEQQYKKLKESSLIRSKCASFSKKTDMGIHGGMTLEGQKKAFDKMLSPNCKGANMRTVWTIATKSFKESHFATYPEDLIVPVIKSGCPGFVCKKCGKAREKILKPTEEYAKFLGKGWHDHKADSQMGFGHSTRGLSKRKGNVDGIQRYKNLGYSNCGCNSDFSGGIVLDPFMGAGTTGLVAKKLRRNYIGIELNSEYIKMAENRIKAIGEFLL